MSRIARLRMEFHKIPSSHMNFHKIPGPAQKFQVLHGKSRSYMEIPGRPYVKSPPMPRWLRRPFVASRSLWVGGLCRRSIAGWLLAGWLVTKKEATERRAHDRPKQPQITQRKSSGAPWTAPLPCVASRGGRARSRYPLDAKRERATAARRAGGVPKNVDRRPATGKRHAATAADKRTFHRDRDSHRGPASRRRTPRGAARRGGWVRRVRRVLVGGVRGHARSRKNCAVGGRRGRCPFAAATAT